jgi:hypothetical protein
MDEGVRTAPPEPLKTAAPDTEELAGTGDSQAMRARANGGE